MQQHEADLKRLGVEHLYIHVRLDGAPSEAKDGFDVDYEKAKLGLFELMDMKMYAASILGGKIDITTRDSCPRRRGGR